MREQRFTVGGCDPADEMSANEVSALMDFET